MFATKCRSDSQSRWLLGGYLQDLRPPFTILIYQYNRGRQTLYQVNQTKTVHFLDNLCKFQGRHRQPVHITYTFQSKGP